VNGILRAAWKKGPTFFPEASSITAIYSTLGDYRFPNAEDAAHDLRGPKVYAADDARKLDEVDDVIFDQATGAIVYAVIDTGGWLPAKSLSCHPNGCRPRRSMTQIFV
jgi:hypothetical protein